MRSSWATVTTAQAIGVGDIKQVVERECVVIADGHAALVINLPGQPKAIAETLEGLKDAEGKSIVPGIFAAVPYCIDLIGGPYIETDEAVVKAFRPKSAIKK